MATLEDVKKALEAMSEIEFPRWQKATGIHWDRQEILGLFWHNSPDVHGLEHYLWLQTEEDKVQQATIEAARATVDAAESAIVSARWSRIAAVVSFLALIVSIVGIYISLRLSVNK